MSLFICPNSLYNQPFFLPLGEKERSTLSFVLRIQVEEQGKFIFKVKFD